VALVVERREAWQALADAAGKYAALLDRLEGLRRYGRDLEAGDRGACKNQRYALYG